MICYANYSASCTLLPTAAVFVVVVVPVPAFFGLFPLLFFLLGPHRGDPACHRYLRVLQVLDGARLEPLSTRERGRCGAPLTEDTLDGWVDRWMMGR